MLLQVFNSTIVSGPETLVIPSLARLEIPLTVVFLCELRREADCKKAVAYAQSFGLKTQEVWVRSRYDKKAVQELAQVFENLQATLIHSHDVKASTYTLAASRVSERRGKKNWKLLSTHHGVRGRSGIKIKAYEWYYTRFILPHFDRVLAVCNSDQKLLANRGLNAKQVLAHLNGVDGTAVPSESRKSEQAKIRKAWGIADRGVNTQSVLIGFVGRLSPEKRLNRILNICSLVEKNYPSLPSWNLIIFGTGALDTELKALTKQYQLDHRVTWMGYRSGLGHELAGFDVVISMSDAEGLPINLIESGWGGTPVFATRVDGNLDLIPENRFGVLVGVEEADFEIAQKLADLINDPIRQKAIGIEFQNRVKTNFSGKRWRDDLLKIYQGLQGN